MLAAHDRERMKLREGGGPVVVASNIQGSAARQRSEAQCGGNRPQQCKGKFVAHDDSFAWPGRSRKSAWSRAFPFVGVCAHTAEMTLTTRTPAVVVMSLLIKPLLINHDHGELPHCMQQRFATGLGPRRAG